jgi:demethylmenaquinone methyltransferase/2-methoxy-6-polyprenyl-1,4-benzoquinol methylase
MTTSYYVDGAERAQRVQSLFDRIASRYDLINDLQSLGLHRVWKRQAIRLAAVRPGDRVVDICCGTGDLAWEFARRGARVVGIDFSQPMLAVASRRRQPPTRPPFFCCADALRLPLAASSVRSVTISYGLRNLADLEAGLRELWRVLQPGGSLVILDFAWPRSRIWRACYRGYLRWLVPVLGRLLCGDGGAYAYILQSLDRYPAQDGVAKLLQRHEPTALEVRELLGGVMSIHVARKPGCPPPAPPVRQR